MNCPNPKCKSSLQVARTYAEAKRTVRERRCPKCGTYHKTVEVFETEISKLRQELHDAKHQKDLEQFALERELAEIKGAVRTLFEAAQEKKKK